VARQLRWHEIRKRKRKGLKQKEIAKEVEAIRAEIAEIKNKASGILEATQNKSVKC